LWGGAGNLRDAHVVDCFDVSAGDPTDADGCLDTSQDSRDTQKYRRCRNDGQGQTASDPTRRATVATASRPKRRHGTTTGDAR
jgi:hypothetical protein